MCDKVRMTAALNTQAYARSLGIDQNPHLRDYLAELATAGSATSKQLSIIPGLSGNLSVAEENAVRRTLDVLDGSPACPALETYLTEGADARVNFIAARNHEGAANERSTKFMAIGAGVGGAFGLVLGIATGLPAVAIAGLYSGAIGATLSAVFGYSRAGAIDSNISNYGRYS